MNENKNTHRKITMTPTQTTYMNPIAFHTGKKGARPAEIGALASVFEKSATTKISKMQTNNTNSDI